MWIRKNSRRRSCVVFPRMEDFKTETVLGELSGKGRKYEIYGSKYI